MRATFSDDDVDKPVENDAGEAVGVVIAVEGDMAHVRPDPAVVNSIKSSLGWEKGAEETVVLDRGSVRTITADAVRLEGGLPIRDGSAVDADAERDGSPDRTPETEPTGRMSAADEMAQIEAQSRGAEVDPTELADRDSGLSARPDDDDQRTDAAVAPDEDADRTDAAVDPDAIRESESTDRGPTTEDGARGLEDDPETERLADADSDAAREDE